MNDSVLLENLVKTNKIKKPKILMVDDRPENLITLRKLLSDLDVELYSANGGNEALKLTLHHDFSLALLDIQMPGMDGYELAEILRSDDRTARIPFIFVSAIYTDQIHIFKGYEKGAFSFITKPFEPMVLISKVEFFIEKYWQQQMLIYTQQLLEKQVEDLKQSNQDLEFFTYSVSHDLRAPLRALDGFSQMVVESLQEEENKEIKHYLDAISTNVHKMTQLIDDILSFSRLGKQTLSTSKIDLNLLTKEVYEEVVKQEGYTNVEFTIGKLPEINGDNNLMHQALHNLLSNAMKYSSKKKKPKVDVGVTEQGGRNVFFVRDNGAGFDMKYYDKLFDVFQRLHGDNEFSGNGVGLAFVKRIINRHGGEIWAEGTPDKGATFYFSVDEG